MIKRFIKFSVSAIIIAIVFSCENAENVVPVTGVVLDEKSITVCVGGKDTLSVTVVPDNASDVFLKWSSSDDAVAVVDEGVVTGVSEGSASITVGTEDGKYYDVCTVEVYEPATGISLDCEDLVIEVGETFVLTASVLPEGNTQEVIWLSSDESVVTVEGGNVTSLASGEAVVSASVNGGTLIAECRIISGLGKISFRSDKTWEIGSQIWSDAVMASRADKDDYNGGVYLEYEYRIDCRQNGEYGDWFSWMAVDKYKEEMCPDGWRVPTTEDFVDLDIAFGGDGSSTMMDMGVHLYLEEWGGEYGGYVWFYENQVQFTEVGSYGAYWTQSSADEYNGYALCFGGAYGFRTPQAKSDKCNGFAVRCVKDK